MLSRVVTLAALAGLATPAHAAGYFFNGVGVRSISRAGAVVASGDDLSGQYANPATLIRVDSQVQLQLAATHQYIFFDRTDEADLSFEPVTSSGGPLPIPHLGAAWRVSDDLTLAAGFFTPYGAALAFPEDGAQRFSLVDSSILHANAGPSVAWRPIPGLSIGGGVYWTMVQLDQTIIAHVSPAAGFQPTDNPTYDVDTAISAGQLNKVTWNAGLTYDTERFGFGVSYTPKVAFEATGSMVADFTKNGYYTGTTADGEPIAFNGSSADFIQEATATDDSVTLPLAMPPIARVGFLFRPSDRAEIELSGVWQGWSTLEDVVLTDLDMTIETSFKEPSVVNEDVDLPISMKDAFAVRLGGQRALSKTLIGRAGLYYESTAAAVAHRSVLAPDAGKVGYGIGAGVVRGRVTLDAGLTQGFSGRSDLSGSQVYQLQIDPLEGDVLRGKTVSNGEFGLINTAAGLSASVAL
ncbi:MAG: outer membrane protein transport protein [Myxococcota bacterium]|nr:outer membrane protein transport protein [Myxococcota bacterium]